MRSSGHLICMAVVVTIITKTFHLLSVDEMMIAPKLKMMMVVLNERPCEFLYTVMMTVYLPSSIYLVYTRLVYHIDR